MKNRVDGNVQFFSLNSLFSIHHTYFLIFNSPFSILMTELYIDGTSAYLPQDLAVQVKRENPLFTKNGEYTYDITLPLSAPANAELYSHLNRLNSVTEVKTKRRAVLVADNRVYCNGTEVVTGWTHDTVSIQIASGNSELNYVIGGDLQVSFLDGMPETGTVIEAGARFCVTQRYPEAEMCMPMVYDRDAGEILNPWFVDNTVDPPELTPGDLHRFDVPGADMERFYPQPYLCAYLRYLFEALGYELEYNFLEETIYKDLYIVNAFRTMKWNEMLPGWSVADFLEQVELLFNATVVVDNRRRTARLLCRSTFYTTPTVVHVLQVEDEYETESADEDDDPAAVQLTHCDVRYNLPDNAYWRARCLPQSVKAAAKKGTIPANFHPTDSLLGRLDAWFADAAHQRTDTIYTDAKTGRKAYWNQDREVENSPKDHWQLLDEFAAIERDDPEQEVELEMMPAELAQVNIALYFRESSSDWAYVNYRYPMPAVDGAPGYEDGEDSAEDEEASTPVSDLIEQADADNGDEDGSTSTGSKGKIFLAFYGGLELPVPNYAGVKLPMSFTDEVLYVWATNECLATDGLAPTLRLQDIEGDLWQDTLEMDLDNEITFRIHDPNLYDARQVFEIRNRRYVCKEMEFTLDANGRKGAWTGTFYPIRMNDTQADTRWILADGKWRDNGVWLDNGRWLDE